MRPANCCPPGSIPSGRCPASAHLAHPCRGQGCGVTNNTGLTTAQRQRAWQSSFLFSLDLHVDNEVAWEAEQWRELNASGIAGLCEQLLRERRADDFTIPAEVSRSDLDALWGRVPRAPVMRLV